jgi:SSS family transporter
MPNLSDLYLHWVDVLVIGGYLGLLLVVGVYHSRRQKSLSEFFLAGQEMRWAVVGMSMLAALNSGMDYLMQPGNMIKFGACVLVFNLTWLAVLPYVCFVTVPLFRRLGAITAYAYLERRFDVRVRLMAATIFMLWRMGWLAAALYVPALVISTASGGRLSPAAVTISIGLLITAYTTLGGIRAVIWNDVIQFCVMFTGLAITVGLTAFAVNGGLGTILAQLATVGEPAALTAPPGSPAGPCSYFYVPMSASGFFVAMLVVRLGTYTSDQVMVQRVQTARTVKDARWGFVVTAASDVVWMLALCFVGLALYAFYTQKGGLPDWAIAHPDRIFPYFVSHVFPIGLTGLVIAAILAASISSIDSALNSLTSTAMIDFVGRLRGGRQALSTDDQRKRDIRLSRLTTFVIGMIGISISLQVSTLGSLVEISNKIVNSFAGPMFGVYLLGMFTRRANALGVLVGGAIGALVTLVTAFQAELKQFMNFAFSTNLNPKVAISFLWPSPFGFVTTCAVGYLASLLTSSTDRGHSRKWTWAGVTRADEVTTS